MTIVPDTKLGAYQILTPLGAGGMGEVYRAKDTRLERRVALKVLPADFINEPDRLRRFALEVKAASALNHQNILNLFRSQATAKSPITISRRYIMKFKTIILTTTMVLTMFVAAFAADIDGKWTGQVQGPQGAMDITIVLKADGEKLTGTYASQLGETAIKEGSIKGSDVAFKVEREFNGAKFTLVYKGKLAGDEIKLTRTMEGDFGGQTPPATDFTVKRAK